VSDVIVRNTRAEDFVGVIELTAAVYPQSPPWKQAQLASHLAIFPDGQFVAEDTASGRIVGMSASLVVRWDDYDLTMSWRDFTAGGMFTNHDPETGHTLYGAEVMCHPDLQGRGVGSKLYDARRELVLSLGLLRIRAGSRLRGYHRHADRLTPEAYVTAVVAGEIRDPTLSFQLHRGFRVLAVVPDYLHHEPESLGHAAIIEWLNPEVARPEDWAGRDPRFEPRHA